MSGRNVRRHRLRSTPEIKLRISLRGNDLCYRGYPISSHVPFRVYENLVSIDGWITWYNNGNGPYKISSARFGKISEAIRFVDNLRDNLREGKK